MAVVGNSLRATLATAVSTAAGFTSSVMDIEDALNLGLHIIWTGTTAGTYDVQVSNDPVQTSWVSVTLPSVPTAAGSAAAAFVNMNLLGASFLRVVFTRTSGTGTSTIYAVGKSI